ncbi:hypothetical protein [Aquabacterium sp.]|nr:hypothetical protein [Aquabacterium sp.]HSW05358.1 hypothetical protein [Aquabacterium sp.]
MSLIILSLLVLALVWNIVRRLWRLWSLLPHRNADFGLVDGDTGGRP